MLDSAAAGENIWSDKDNPRPPVARLTVEDTTQGGNISYIEVSDSGNFWVVDDICTDAKSPCTPVDGFVKGPSSKRIDIVFLKDAQYTGTDADYESVVKSMINDRLFAHEPIKSKKSSFNFYISKKLIGDSKSPGPPTCGPATLPANFYSLCPYADAVAVLHSLTYGDCCASGVFSTEANIDRSFIHEVGHAALGLHDQYDDAPGCRTYRPPKSYNTYINKTECENDATAHGFDATKCYQFTTCPAGPGVRWELDEGKEFIMDDGLHHANGWSSSSEWRIGEYLDNLALGLGKPDGALEPASETRSMLMELEISDSGITLREDPRVVVSAAPQYLVPPYEYSVIILNNAGGLLGAFGFEDPRKIYAESDYSGPVTTGTVANKTLIVPYFSTADTSVVSNGEQTLNIDVSPLAGLPAGTLRADAGGPYEGEVGDLIIFNASQSEASTSNISVYEWDIGGTG